MPLKEKPPVLSIDGHNYVTQYHGSSTDYDLSDIASVTYARRSHPSTIKMSGPMIYGKDGLDLLAFLDRYLLSESGVTVTEATLRLEENGMEIQVDAALPAGCSVGHVHAEMPENTRLCKMYDVRIAAPHFSAYVNAVVLKLTPTFLNDTRVFNCALSVYGNLLESVQVEPLGDEPKIVLERYSPEGWVTMLPAIRDHKIWKWKQEGAETYHEVGSDVASYSAIFVLVPPDMELP